MEIEKTLTVSAPREQVWALLLDPEVMAGAVPGMQSIEVLSPTEYLAVMHQKISFISAKFKLRTRIVEQRAPVYLRVEGTGEDSSVASSLKQRSEVFLDATPEGGTALRIKVDVDLLGRLGAFGLSVMKTKADRLWDEFGANLAARIEAGGPPPAPPVPGRAPEPVCGPAAASVLPPAACAPDPAVAGAPPQAAAVQALQGPIGKGWWGRIFCGGPPRDGAPDTIRVELQRGDTRISVQWPGARADECTAWLRDCLR